MCPCLPFCLLLCTLRAQHRALHMGGARNRPVGCAGCDRELRPKGRAWPLSLQPRAREPSRDLMRRLRGTRRATLFHEAWGQSHTGKLERPDPRTSLIRYHFKLETLRRKNVRRKQRSLSAWSVQPPVYEMSPQSMSLALGESFQRE